MESGASSGDFAFGLRGGSSAAASSSLSLLSLRVCAARAEPGAGVPGPLDARLEAAPVAPASAGRFASAARAEPGSASVGAVVRPRFELLRPACGTMTASSESEADSAGTVFLSLSALAASATLGLRMEQGGAWRKLFEAGSPGTPLTPSLCLQGEGGDCVLAETRLQEAQHGPAGVALEESVGVAFFFPCRARAENEQSPSSPCLADTYEKGQQRAALHGAQRNKS